MPSVNSLSIALKEWAVVCHALEKGRQIILFRKGGIHESAGEFELEHPRFLLFPTYVHQKLEMIQPAARAEINESSHEPSQVRLSVMAKVTDIRQLQSRAQLNHLEHEHIWLPPLLDIRWNYRPENPLYLLLLRVYRLAEAVIIPNTLAYAGCKSWVPLEPAISVAASPPAIPDDEYNRRRAVIFESLQSA